MARSPVPGSGRRGWSRGRWESGLICIRLTLFPLSASSLARRKLSLGDVPGAGEGTIHGGWGTISKQVRTGNEAGAAAQEAAETVLDNWAGVCRKFSPVDCSCRLGSNDHPRDAVASGSLTGVGPPPQFSSRNFQPPVRLIGNSIFLPSPRPILDDHAFNYFFLAATALGLFPARGTI